jgi:Glycosyl transferase family 11
MITFYSQGGLGNQLFQYAAARSLAYSLDKELVLDPYWFKHPRPGETVRSLELTNYRVKLRIANIDEQRRWKFLRTRWARYLGPLMPMQAVREQGYAYNESFGRIVDDSYLVGAWQSERYFRNIREVLLDELTPIQAPSIRDAELLRTMQACDSICVHVRRGDYVSSNSASAYHGVCSLDYYERAINHVVSQVRKPSLFIFSDDPDWTREHLRTQHPSHYITHNSPDDAFQDLRLMSHCKHHVIANSSFSWWGAWLSTSPGQIVVAPEKWFSVSRPTPDLLPPEWKRL